MNTTRTTPLTRLALGVPIMVAAAFGVPATAQGDTPPPSKLMPGGTYCSFDVYRTTLTDHSAKPPNNPGPSTGNFVVQFTNPLNGKSATFNVSGATRPPTTSGTTTTVVFTGPSWFGFGPQSQVNTKQPGIVYSPGRTVVEFDNTTGPDFIALSFSPTAPVTDICALLSSP